ncbi:hypothetical protein AB0N07_01460 [Streptomyces sp. NPDC051172]|uniref:hypothetical protein n=1 Tax=Streptomyces sp. NPDC051172 TaxID=3155796 RepID=UPI00343559DC
MARPGVRAGRRRRVPRGHPGRLVTVAPRWPTQVDLTGPGSGATDAVATVVEQTEEQANDVVAALLAHARHQGEHE